MNITNVWYFALVQEDKRYIVNEILKCLSEVGINIYIPDDNEQGHSGLIIFDKISSELVDIIFESSSQGHKRVLALGVSKTELKENDGWRLLDAGASDLIFWDDSPQLVAQINAIYDRWQAVENIMNSPQVKNCLVGQSTSWVLKLRQIVEFSKFTKQSLLLMGESGTGKELVSHLVHSLSSSGSESDLVIVDCTTIVPELSGSELFGHERGAFTGAITMRDGAFALANGGTLFLDEIGELPIELQAQLLRVIQEKTYKRVGSNTWRRTNFRLVSATNRKIMDEITNGKFRQDLYYRISDWVCELPPLRERKEDILLLVDHFFSKLSPSGSRIDLDITVKDHLVNREYPGNIRELKQLVTRISNRHVGPGPITLGDIPVEERPDITLGNIKPWQDSAFKNFISYALSSGLSLKEVCRLTKDAVIQLAVSEEGGNLQRAAERLGCSDRSLQTWQAENREKNKIFTNFDNVSKLKKRS